jgi:hypothetical protein
MWCCERSESMNERLNWDEIFESLRRIADIADTIAGDIEDSTEYHKKWDEDHDLAVVTVNEMITIMKKAAQMAEDVGITMDRKAAC